MTKKDCISPDSLGGFDYLDTNGKKRAQAVYDTIGCVLFNYSYGEKPCYKGKTRQVGSFLNSSCLAFYIYARKINRVNIHSFEPTPILFNYS